MQGNELTECPSCGCPAGLYSLESLGFSVSIASRYRLARVRLSGGMIPEMIVEDAAQSERYAIGRLPKDPVRSFFLRKLEIQKSMEFPYLPHVLEINEEEGYFCYEAVEWESLQGVLEQENPLGRYRARDISMSIEEEIEELERFQFVYGGIVLEQVGIRDGMIRFLDYGIGMPGRPTGMSILALRTLLQYG